MNKFENISVPENNEDVISSLEKRVKKLTEVYNDLDGILGWGDIVSADRPILEKKKEFIKNEREAILKEIDQQFDLIYKEIVSIGEIKSSSGKIYQAEAVINSIKKERDIVMNGGVMDKRNITRSENLRDRISKLLDIVSLILKLTSIF